MQICWLVSIWCWFLLKGSFVQIILLSLFEVFCRCVKIIVSNDYSCFKLIVSLLLLLYVYIYIIYIYILLLYIYILYIYIYITHIHIYIYIYILYISILYLSIYIYIYNIYTYIYKWHFIDIWFFLFWLTSISFV